MVCRWCNGRDAVNIMINTFADCPNRRDDEYMEGYGEYYCDIWIHFQKNKHGRNVGATYSCNYNCDNKRCPKGYAR